MLFYLTGVYGFWIVLSSGLNTCLISAIFEDKKGNVWFGTDEKTENNFQGNGLFRYDGNTLTHFTSKDGLSTNAIKCVVEDNAGKLWFGTEINGVSSFAPDAIGTGAKAFTNYSEKDGLFNDNTRTAMKDKNGNLWFGAFDMGLTRYNGKSFVGFTEK